MEPFAYDAPVARVIFGSGIRAPGADEAIAFNTDLPQIVLPTTYAGSAVTSILGQIADGENTTLRSPKVQPEVAAAV